MSFLQKITELFKSSPKPAAEPEPMLACEYDGYTIIPAPVQEETGFRVNGTIIKGEREHQFIRADVLPTADSCADEMIRKAKQMIDQQGERLFG